MTDLQTAFQETGTQLDRIIDAFKREPQVQNYPRWLAFDFDGDHETVIRINQDLSSSPISGTFVNHFLSRQEGNYCVVYWDEDLDGEITDDGEDGPVLKFDLSTFAITEKLDGYSDNARWIDDPSA